MTDLVSPIPALLEKLLARPGAELLKHHRSHDEWALVGFGNARIGVQWHHQNSSSSVFPAWGSGARHLTFAYAVACYVAGEVVDPLQGVAGEIDFIVDHLDVIRAICEDEDSWIEYKSSVAQLLHVPNQFVDGP